MSDETTLPNTETTPTVTPPAQETPVVAATPAPTVTPKPTPTLPSLPAIARDDGQIEPRTDAGIAVADAITAYMATLAPGKPVEKEAGGAAQNALHAAMKAALRTSDYEDAWGVVLQYFHRYADNTALDPTKTSRFTNSLKMRTTTEGHLALVRLATATANPRTRKAVIKQFDMRKLVELFEAGIQDNILAFYA